MPWPGHEPMTFRTPRQFITSKESPTPSDWRPRSCYLSCSDKHRKYDGAKTYAKHTVNHVTSEEAEYDIRPGVPGVEAHELTGVQTQIFLHSVLKGGRVIITEVAT